MNRAILYRRFGGPDVLEMADVPEVAPAAGEVLVEVRTAGLNPVDAKTFDPIVPLKIAELVAIARTPSRWFGRGPARFPRVVGRDFAGVVVALGEGVSGLSMGQCVMGTLRSAPGQGAVRGSLITRLVAPASDCIATPQDLGVEVAGALGVAAQTACGALRKLDVGAGDVLVVSAASGGVGSLITQLAVRRGAAVIGIAGTGSADYVRSLGAIPVSYGGDVIADVRAVAPRPVTRFLDCYGGDYVRRALSLGLDHRHVATLVPSLAALRNRIAFTGSRHAQPGDLEEVAALIAEGVVHVEIVDVIPFDADAVREAYSRLLAGHIHGKIVVDLSRDRR